MPAFLGDTRRGDRFRQRRGHHQQRRRGAHQAGRQTPWIERRGGARCTIRAARRAVFTSWRRWCGSACTCWRWVAKISTITRRCATTPVCRRRRRAHRHWPVPPTSSASCCRAWPIRCSRACAGWRWGDTDLAHASPNRIRAAATAAAPIPDRPGLPPLPDQTLRLLERDARRGDEEPKHHALVALAEAPIAEAFQRVPNEAVGLVPIPRLEVHRLVAFHEGAKLPDCAWPPRLNVHDHPRMMRRTPVSPSLRVGIDPSLHPHFALDSTGGRRVGHTRV